MNIAVNPRAVVGDNNPPDPLEEAIAPYTDSIEEAENWLDGKAVTDEPSMKAVDALLKDVKKAHKAAEDARKAEGEPYRLKVVAINEHYKVTTDELNRMKTGLVKLTGDFKAKLAKEKADAERKAQREAWERAETARKAAEELDASNIEEAREVAEVQRQAEEAQKAAATARAANDVKGMRTVWRHEIENPQQLIAWIWGKDKQALIDFVSEYARKNAGKKDMAGVNAWQEKEAF